jgi:DNA-binding NtrC family response regulator
MAARESVSLRIKKTRSLTARSRNRSHATALEASFRNGSIPLSKLLPPPFARLATANPDAAQVFAIAAILASTLVSVVIEGPKDSCKDVLARRIHEASRSAAGPFVVLNAREVGKEATGTNALSFARILERARGGTLVIDEPCDLDLAGQDELLAALAERSGSGNSALECEERARILVTTTIDLESLSREGRFRDALFIELADARLALPAPMARPLFETAANMPARNA